MAPLPISLVGYRVSYEAIQQYLALKNLSKYSLLVEDLESKIGVPLVLVLVEPDEDDEDGGAGPAHHYFCFFADYSGRPYDCKDLLAIPVPPAFHQLRQLIPVEGDVQWLFAPRATFFPSRKPKLNERGLPIGDGHV